MTRPSVQIRFGAGPLATGGAWTDVTDTVRFIETNVGRQRRLDQYEPGTATIGLDNTSRRYDPLYTSGSYYGSLLPGRQIRVGTGYAYQVAARSGLESYWRLGEATGTTAHDDTGLADGTLRATGAFGATGLLNAGVNGALACDGTAYNGVTAGDHAEHSVDTTGELSVVAWINLATVASNQAIVARQSTAGGNEWILYCNSAGYLVCVLYNTASGNYAITGNLAGTKLTAATTTHVAFTWDGTTLRVYRDGVEGATDSVFSGTLQGNVAGTVTAIGHRDTAGSIPANGTIDEVAIYNRALTATEILADYTEGSTGSYDTNLFVGTVDGWPQDYDADDAYDLEITCTDRFGELARNDLTRSVYALTVLGNDPWVWWRQHETVGTDAADSSGNNRLGSRAYDIQTYERVPLPIVGETDRPGMPLQTNGPVNWSLFPVAIEANASSSFSVECWFYCDPFTSNYTNGSVDLFYEFATPWRLYAGDLSGTTNLRRLAVTDGTNTRRTSTDCVNDGRVHHVVVTSSPGSGVKFYVDGAAVAGTGTSPAAPTHWNVLAKGSPTTGGVTGTIPVMKSGLTGAVIYTSELTSTQVAALYDAATNPWDGDASGARIQRILDTVAWPSLYASIDTGQVDLGPAVLGENLDRPENALGYLLRVADSEQGQLYCDPVLDGAITFRQRHHRLTAARSITSQVTFSDAGTGGTYPYDRATITYDEDLIVNEVSVAWAAGEVTVSDAASIAAYGRRAKSVRTELSTYSEAWSLADWILSRYASPTVRVRDVTLNAAAVTGAEAPAFDTRLDDRVTVRKLPQDTGSAIERELIVEGISHRIGDGLNEWAVTFYTSEADAGPYWIAGTSTAGETTVPAW